MLWLSRDAGSTHGALDAHTASPALGRPTQIRAALKRRDQGSHLGQYENSFRQVAGSISEQTWQRSSDAHMAVTGRQRAPYRTLPVLALDLSPGCYTYWPWLSLFHSTPGTLITRALKGMMCHPAAFHPLTDP